MANQNGQKSAACDRCRGQKLRCIWDPKEAQCQRCQRAEAICIVPSPRPMGRPPRHFRSTSTQGHNAHDTSAYSRCEGTSTSTASGDEDMMTMNHNVLADTMDFLQWQVTGKIPCLERLLIIVRFPEPDNLIFTATGNATSATPILAHPNASVSNARQFSPQDDSVSATLVSQPRDVVVDQIDEDEDQGLIPTGREHIHLLMQLGELNVALFQHPLHVENDKARTRSIPTLVSMQRQSPRPSSSHSHASPELKLADLQIGKLLGMTQQLKKIVSRIRSLDEDASRQTGRHDRSTALMALSCYTRLDILYTRTLQILSQVRTGGQQIKDIHLLMPDLVVDGFSLSWCHELQLSVLVHVHEQAHEQIRACIRTCGQALLNR